MLVNDNVSDPATWVKCSFNINDLDRVFSWIEERQLGRYTLSLDCVRFENPASATLFEIGFTSENT